MGCQTCIDFFTVHVLTWDLLQELMMRLIDDPDPVHLRHQNGVAVQVVLNRVFTLAYH